MSGLEERSPNETEQGTESWRLRALRLEEELRQLSAKAGKSAERLPDQHVELRKKRNVRDMTLAERQMIADNLYIEYPRLVKLRNRIIQCHTSYGLREPRCAFIYGGTGAGKSWLQERYRLQSTHEDSDDGTTVPIVCITIDSRATTKSVASAILKALGDPQWHKGTSSILLQRVTGLMGDCGVRLLVLDEFHHLVDLRTTRVVHEVSEWVKTLIITTKVPVVAFGQEAGLEALKSNEQLGRRFPIRERLEPFSCDSDEGFDEITTLLQFVDKALPLGERSNLDNPQTVRSIWYATGGVMYYVMELVKQAAWGAVRDNRESITEDDLARAFNECIAAVKPHLKNPFVP